MYLSDAVRERIKFYQKKNGMSLWALFKASGVPISTLAAFMSKRTELIKLDTLLLKKLNKTNISWVFLYSAFVIFL